jgi:uncharacterized protein (DUF2147 family)
MLILLIPVMLKAQTVTGKWTSFDEKTGKPNSIIEIYENNGKLYGKIIKVFNPKYANAKCIKCTGADYNKPIIGLVIMKNLIKDGDEYSGGEIFDPEHGKTYKCKIKLKDKNKLELRGFIGFSLIGKTQIWTRSI